MTLPEPAGSYAPLLVSPSTGMSDTENRMLREKMFGSGFDAITRMPEDLEKKLRLDENAKTSRFVNEWFEPRATRYSFSQYIRSGEPILEEYLSTVIAGVWRGTNPLVAHLVLAHYEKAHYSHPLDAEQTRVAIGLYSNGRASWLYVPGKGFRGKDRFSIDQLDEALALVKRFQETYDKS